MANPPKKRVDTDELLRKWESNKKSRIFLTLAEEYRRQDFIDSAVSVLQDGLKHHANFLPAHVSLARCHMVRRKYAEAQGELEQVLSKSPDNLLAGKLLAEVLTERGELSKALEALKKLVPFAPDDPEVEERIGELEGQLKTPSLGSGSGDTTEFGTGDTTEFGVGDTSEFGVDGAPSPADAAELDIGGSLGAMPGGLSAVMGESPDLEGEDPVAASEPVSAPAEEASPAPAATEPDLAQAAPAEEAEAEMPQELVSETLPEQPAASSAADLFGGAMDAAEAPAESDPFAVPDDGGAAPDPFGAADPLPDLGEPPGDLLGNEAALGGAAAEVGGESAEDAAAAEQEDQTSITLAELYEGQGSYEEAAALYEKLVSRRPDDRSLKQALERCRQQTRPEPAAAVAPAVAEKPPAPPVTAAKPAWEAPRAVPQVGQAGGDAAAAEATTAQLEAMMAEYQRWLDAVQSLK